MMLLVKTSGDSRGRREIFDRLKSALEAHAAAEERVFYAALLKDDVGRPHAAHSIAEHEEVRELLETLDEMDFDSPAWLPKARTLVERNTHHIEEEEKEIFPVAGRVMTAAQKEELAALFEPTKTEEEEAA